MALGGDPHYGPQYQLDASAKEHLKFYLGQYDHILLTESGYCEFPVDGGPWFAIRCVRDGSGVVAIESPKIRTDEWDADTTMNAGDVIYGIFTGVGVAMDSAVIVYSGPYWVWPT